MQPCPRCSATLARLYSALESRLRSSAARNKAFRPCNTHSISHVFPTQLSLHMRLQPIHLSLSAPFRILSNARSATPYRGSQVFGRCGPDRESTGMTPFHEATPRNAPDCATLSLVGNEPPI